MCSSRCAVVQIPLADPPLHRAPCPFREGSLDTTFWNNSLAIQEPLCSNLWRRQCTKAVRSLPVCAPTNVSGWKASRSADSGLVSSFESLQRNPVPECVTEPMTAVSPPALWSKLREPMTFNSPVLSQPVGSECWELQNASVESVALSQLPVN